MYAIVMVVSCSWAVLIGPFVYAYDNLALKKKAWQNIPAVHIDVGSTRYYLGADRAVDGLKRDLSWDGGHCAASLHGQSTVEWRVDLEDIFSIHHIYLQYVTGNVEWGVHNLYTKNFLGFSIFISNTTKKQDGVLCFHDTNYTRATIPNPVNITCPHDGRYVIYYNNRTDKPYPDGYSYYAYNDLCEVEVYGCPSQGYYGEKCNLKCPENCHERRCHITNGTCLGCLTGYHGEYCSITCPQNCQERRCHITNGTCLGCLPGYHGEYCSIPCPQNCQERRCHITNGTCLGCLTGYHGEYCSIPCPQNCQERRCHITNGTCLGCLPGYHGEYCSIPCPQNCQERRCHITNGTCLGCLPGYHGEYCSIPCPQNCQERRCHITKGTCLGCLQGYYGEICSLPCPQKCQFDRCHVTEGSCHGCIVGYYGETCSLVCPHNCLERRCHATNGTCLGCESGYLGARCKQKCPDGLYGHKCAHKCSVDCGDPGICDKITGNCYDF